MCQKHPLENFLMLIPKVSQAKCYGFLIINPFPPPTPHISDCKHFFIDTWDALETSGWMA